MNGKTHKGAEFAFNFRCDLFREHLDMSLEEVADPICDTFWERMQSIAKV